MRDVEVKKDTVKEDVHQDDDDHQGLNDEDERLVEKGKDGEAEERMKPAQEKRETQVGKHRNEVGSEKNRENEESSDSGNENITGV